MWFARGGGGGTTSVAASYVARRQRPRERERASENSTRDRHVARTMCPGCPVGVTFAKGQSTTVDRREKRGRERRQRGEGE